jgi:prephenate dehydratase
LPATSRYVFNLPRKFDTEPSIGKALGQCSGFLSKYFPNATLEKKPSTALAAQLLLEDDERNLHSAAIASTLCAKLFDGLEILQRSVQDTNSLCALLKKLFQANFFLVNFTRFFILSNSLETVPPVVHTAPQIRRALVRLLLPPSERVKEQQVSDAEEESPTPPKPAHSRAVHLILGTLLTTFGVPVIRVDRRPSINSCPFEDTYFLELEDFGTPVEPSPNGPLEEGWLKRVRQGVERVIAAGAQADVIGVW